MEDFISLSDLFVSASLGLFGIFQYYVQRKRESRERDLALLSWAEKVINNFVKIELCFASADRRVIKHEELEPFLFRNSALLDNGRFFFANTSKAQYRHKILDELSRASKMITSYKEGDKDLASKYRELMWITRRYFVKLLQVEMGKSLMVRREHEAGISIDSNPLLWPERDGHKSWWI